MCCEIKGFLCTEILPPFRRSREGCSRPALTAFAASDCLDPGLRGAARTSSSSMVVTRLRAYLSWDVNLPCFDAFSMSFVPLSWTCLQKRIGRGLLHMKNAHFETSKLHQYNLRLGSSRNEYVLQKKKGGPFICELLFLFINLRLGKKFPLILAF